jgi:hypothetical protein
MVYPLILTLKISYPLVNKQLDPENHPFLMETIVTTSLPSPMTARVEVFI